MIPAIQLINVHKYFNIPREKHDTLKEKFVNFHRKVHLEEFKALNDINLFIDEGEFVGVIGRNGSGKSTLLKLIANIYSPTHGQVETVGNISPFLELGIGFNGDLSARENLYLNGVILGLSRPEIDAMYKKIVQFAELEDFMEMKLKNYSSGMQVRLAFSIASSIDADIYLCDEVLAVGDLDFQKKCFRVFEELKKAGKTIIYVSHDLDTIKQFCTKTYLLEHGRITKEGPTQEVVEHYEKTAT